MDVSMFKQYNLISVKKGERGFMIAPYLGSSGGISAYIYTENSGGTAQFFTKGYFGNKFKMNNANPLYPTAVLAVE